VRRTEIYYANMLPIVILSLLTLSKTISKINLAISLI